MSITAHTQQTIGRVRRIWHELDRAQRRLFEVRTGLEPADRSRPSTTRALDLEVH
jgi:hypothetical protein